MTTKGTGPALSDEPSGDLDQNDEQAAGRMRLDLWLWHSRFFKTRSLATKVVKSKKVRVNSTLVSKAASPVTVGDVLTFVKEGDVKVLKIKALSERRGPYSEAVTLYDDLSPAPANSDKDAGSQDHNPARERGMGRPTKKDRRAFEKLTDQQDP